MTNEEFLAVARRVLLDSPRPRSLEHAFELIVAGVTSGKESPLATDEEQEVGGLRSIVPGVPVEQSNLPGEKES